MNLADIEKMAYERLGYDNSNPGSVVISRIRNHINTTYKQIMGKKVLQPLKNQIFTVASVANTPFLALPYGVQEIQSIADRVNQWELERNDMITQREYDPGLTLSVGNPYAYAVYSPKSAVFLRMTGGGTLLVQSTSTGDVTPRIAHVEGFRLGGYPYSASVAVTGTTKVQVGDAGAWDTVTKFWLQKDGQQGQNATLTALGDISLIFRNNPSIPIVPIVDTTIAIIPYGRSFSRYFLLHLYPVPTAVITYTIDAKMLVEDLTELGVEPLLPEDFHWLLVAGAVVKESLLKEKYVTYNAARSEFNEGLGDLMMTVNREPVETARRPRRYSQLGPYYSPGS